MSLMKRRTFISLSSGTIPLISLGYPIIGQVTPFASLVDTAGERLKYTQKLLKQLCADLGPRPSGSDSFANGAQIIKNEMEHALPYVYFDSYEFDSWEITDSPQFIIGGQFIESVPITGSSGTPLGGVKGVIQKGNNGFKIVDRITNETKALFSVNQYGKAITSYIGNRSTNIPLLGIGKQDVPLLENAIRDRKQARLYVRTRSISNAKGVNVVGSLPGKYKDEILFLAHADTVYNSPGANDNSASVIVMLMLAHAASKRAHKHTLTFVATDGEEFGSMGAKNLAKRYIQDNTMDNIRYVVNLDSLTYGPNLWISSQNEGIKEILNSIHKDLNINGNPKFDSKDGFVMDSAPFHLSGAKALHANSRGYDEKTLPIYHRPDDNAENVPLDCVENSFLVFNEYVKRIDLL